jgi:hypothetical protein
MTSKTSLFTKIRTAALALGRSERTATRKARLLSSASFSDFVRLTPEQNAKLSLSPKARHYALRGTKRVTKATPTISARQFETKRASELFGLTPERATQARRHGAVPYVSADQRERVAKAAITREETKVIAEIKKLRASGGHVPSYSPDKRRHGSSHSVSEYAERRYRALRRRKLAGEHIPDGDWQWLVDYGRRFKDARRAEANATDAKTNAEKARKNAEEANANLRKAQIGQSRFLADQARQRRSAGDAGTAVLLGLEGLPDTAAGIDRAYVPEAELQLDEAWRDLRERTLFVGHRGGVWTASFSPDGKRIVTASMDGTARVWDAATGEPVGDPFVSREGQISSGSFSPDGKRIVTVGEKTVRLWDATTGDVIGGPLKDEPRTLGQFTSAAFGPDGERIVTASADGIVRIWDAATD